MGVCNLAIKQRKFIEMAVKHFRSFAREWAMQFLFQNDIESIENREKAIEVFFSQLEDGDTEAFTGFPEPKEFRRAAKATKTMIIGILDNMPEIDALISKYSPKWSIDRMAIVDRNIMRVAVYEMLFCNHIPPVVSINEAIEIGKVYGTDDTASFINGILNAVMGTLDRPSREAVTEE